MNDMLYFPGMRIGFARTGLMALNSEVCAILLDGMIYLPKSLR